MSRLLRSIPGRVLTLAFAIALLGGGTAALLGHSLAAIPLMCVSIMAAVVMTVFALPFALADDEIDAWGLFLVLPSVMFLYVIGLAVVMASHNAAGAYGFLTLGLVALGVAARPSGSSASLPKQAHSH